MQHIDSRPDMQRHELLAASDRGQGDPGLSEIFAAIGRRKIVLLGTVAGALLLASLFLWLATPQYFAETLIMIEPKDSNIVSVESVVGGMSGDEEAVQSQLYVLQSRTLASRVIQRLSLHKDIEFNPEFSDAIETAAEEPARDAIAPDAIAPDAIAEVSAQERGLVIDQFLERLTVTLKDKSRVISAGFASESAEKAATIINTFAAEYILSRLEGNASSTLRANDWLGVRISELRENVQNLERRIAERRAQLGLLGGGGSNLAVQELVGLNTELVVTRSARAEAEAQLSQIEELSPDGNDNESLNQVLDSRLIQRLREQESEVDRRVAELSSEYGSQHPKMIKLRAEAQDLEARIDDEIRRIVGGLRGRVAVIKAREESLQKSLNQLKKQVAVANQDEIELRSLEREAEASRNLLETMLSRQKETLSQDDAGFQLDDVRIISPANIPLKPSYPLKSVVLGLTFILAMILGFIIILILELLDDGFRSGEELERITGIPSIGFVPFIPKTDSYKSLAEYISNKPNSAFSESIRTLSWSIGLAFPAPAPKTVLITSSLPGEGKTTIATCLAVSQSMAGRKTVLIDADTRQPSCHGLLSVAREPGLVDVLTGNATLDEALTHKNLSGLTILPAGSPSHNSPNLLESDKMRELIATLEERFDFIVIDSPPVLATTDARILCQLADATVAVVHWGKTRRAIAHNTLNQLRGAKARLAGSLLTQVNVKKHAQYGYGDSGKYTGDLEKYYAG